MIEEQEVLEPQGTVRITFTGSVIPHWRYEFVEGNREVIQDLVRRANTVIGLLPPGDPQFRRNQNRVQRDADREAVTIEWVGVDPPEDRSAMNQGDGPVSATAAPPRR
ncbi:MAG: hypothetical protein K1X95_03310 [Acidimicrobiia bacterium]|nr:hypothetical protein [Acidimicrobiia bacterium]